MSAGRPGEGFRRVLSPAEASFIAATGARSADAIYALIEANSSLDDGGPGNGGGTRRLELLSLLEPDLSGAFRKWKARERPDVQESPGGALAPSDAVWTPGVRIALFSAAPAPVVPATPAPFGQNDLLNWPVESQGGQPTCVPHAATACLELMLGRAAGGRFPNLSARFLYQRMRNRPLAKPPSGAEAGFTKLSQARDALAQDGVCTSADWPEAGAPDAVPSAAALASARSMRVLEAKYLDMPDPAKRPSGTARLVHAELLACRPVAIALPGFAPHGNPNAPTNWNRGDVMVSGNVTNPSGSDQPVIGSGHAVCVVGFQPSPDEPLGGYFVFRNSRGLDFGEFAPRHGFGDPPPWVPAPGYGTLSAQHVEDHVWELLSLHPPTIE